VFDPLICDEFDLILVVFDPRVHDVFDPLTCRKVQSGQVVSRKSGQVRSSQVRSGQVRSSQVKSGQVRSSQVKITVTFDVLDPLTSRQVESGQVVQT
jgi:hypothetical protein